MAAAPRLFDDLPIASPELALVDADLAAQLRADLATGESFRPRHVPRDEHSTLVFDAVVRELPVDEPHATEEDELYGQVVSSGDADVVDGTPAEHADEGPIAPPVLRALPACEEPSLELPEYLVPSDDEVVDAIPDDAGVSEEESFAQALPEDVVPTDDAMGHEVVEEAASEQATDDSFAPPVLVALPAPEEQSFELPDYVVVPDEDVDAIPDDVVPEENPAPALEEYVVPPVEDLILEDAAPEYVVDEEQIASIEQAPSSSDYPVLPDLEERSEALEETEAALRRIREQMVVGTSPSGRRRRRVRRRFTVLAGLCAVVTVAAFAVELQLGVAHTPGVLAF